jgi:hypothetical protein
MKDFIDKTSTQSGTKINRKALMEAQGFIAVNTTISTDGKSIVETNSDGHTLTTTFNSDGSIVEKFVGTNGITITKTITFNANGNVSKEAVS